MSYLGVVNLIRTECNTINPNGLFVHCRRWDASLEFDSPNCQIALYPMTANISMANHFYESWIIVMGFYFEDAPDSTNEDRELLIASAQNLVQIFLNDLENTEGIEISGIRTEPSYRQMAGTYTGVILNFTLGATSDLCATDTYVLNTDNVILTNTDGTPIQNT